MFKKLFIISLFVVHSIFTMDVCEVFDTELINACVKNDVEKVKLLISQGVEIDKKDHHGKAALHYAVILAQSVEIAELLLQAGADINVKDYELRTPVMWAAIINNKELVKVLIDNKANLHLQDVRDKSALDLLHESRKRNKQETKTLLTKGMQEINKVACTTLICPCTIV